jgi:hypothetical protein
MSSLRLGSFVTLLVGTLILGCRHQPVATAASPLPWPKDEYCWWTAVGTTTPLDSVAARFEHAYEILGLRPVVSNRIGDTVLVRGGPSDRGAPSPDRFASRMVAFQNGDSTRFRWYWSIVPPVDQLASTTPTTSPGGRGIGFCGEIGKLVAIKGWAPRDPTAADSIPVWQRIP